jgi:geranylgeranyl diphosphate synthase type I
MSETIPECISKRYADALETELRRWLSQRKPVGRHYDMLAYHMGWADEHLQPYEGPRGKRFRPLLCLLSCEAAGGDWHDALPIGAAIEFLHNFSLIHDDIEDGDDSRHHRPTMWKLWGEPLAINAGDAMLALSGLAALSISDAPKISMEFQETALALTEGQYLDMTFEDVPSVSRDDYFKMIALKTGALITFACVSGARLGGGRADQINAFREFGHHFGLAFQIYDDIRGIWAPSEQTGKAEAKDIVNRKKSLPVVLAMKVATGSDSDQLEQYYAGAADVEPDVISLILERLGVRSQVEDAQDTHMSQAFGALEGVDLEPARAAELRSLAAGIVGQQVTSLS